MEREYSQFSDEELIDRLRGGDSRITDYIMDKYKNLVRSKAKSMYILGGDNEDLIQEGMIGLFKAIRDYDCGRDASFYTFADLCISRQMYTAVIRSAIAIPLGRFSDISATTLSISSIISLAFEPDVWEIMQVVPGCPFMEPMYS